MIACTGTGDELTTRSKAASSELSFVLLCGSLEFLSTSNTAKNRCASFSYVLPIGPAPAHGSYLSILSCSRRRDRQARMRSIRPWLSVGERRRSQARCAEARSLIFVGPPAAVIAQMGSKINADADWLQRPACRWCPAKRRTIRSDRGIRRAVEADRSAGAHQGVRPAAAARACATFTTAATSMNRSRRRGARRPRRSATATLYVERPRRASPPRRSADFRRRTTVTCCTCSSATARRSGGIRRCSRRVTSPALSPALRARMTEAAVAAARARRTTATPGTIEFLVDGDRLLLPGDEHAPAGRASRHRAGHGIGSRARADPGRQRRSRCPGRSPMSASGDMPSRRASTPRIPRRASCRKPAGSRAIASRSVPVCASIRARPRAARSRCTTIR